MTPVGLIYKIENLLDGKVYIGQTEGGMDGRPLWHFSKCKSKGRPTKLGQAIKLFGSQNFRVQKLAECYSAEDLNWAEKFFILEWYDSINPHRGYNLTKGGKGYFWHLLPQERKEEICSRQSRSLKRTLEERVDLRLKCKEGALNWWKTATEEQKEERRQKIHLSITQKWKDPEFKKRVSTKISKAKNEPEAKLRVSQQSKSRWSDPSYVQRSSPPGSFVTNEGRQRQAKAMTKYWERRRNIG